MAKSKYKSNKRQTKTGFQDVLPTPLLLVLGGIVLLAGALLAVWKAGQPNAAQAPIVFKGAPSLKVDQDKIDLGDLPLGQTVSVSFQLANVGDETLRFSDKPFIEVLEGC
jgi:hypothetical protein